MKNPFPSPVTITDTNRYGDQYIGCPLAAISITVCRGPQDDMNPEEVAEFLVHAINQHDKLVAVVRCLLLSADAAWEADAGGHDWPEACQLARALLKEEKP